MSYRPHHPIEPRPELVALHVGQVAVLARHYEAEAKAASSPYVAAAHQAEAERFGRILIAMHVFAANPGARLAPSSIEFSAQEVAYVSDGYLKSAIAEQAGGQYARGFALAQRGLMLRAEAQRRDPQVVFEPIERMPFAVAGSA